MTLTALVLLFLLLGPCSTSEVGVLPVKCPPTEFGGNIVESNLPQPFSGARCLTNRNGIVQTYVLHERAYCKVGAECSCSEEASYLFFHKENVTMGSKLCHIKKNYVNNYLCACCEGHVEVNKVCVPIPTTATTTTKTTDVRIMRKENIPLAATTREMMEYRTTTEQSPVLRSYFVGGSVGALIIFALLVALLVRCCCCKPTAAPVGDEKQKKIDAFEDRTENVYVEVSPTAHSIRVESDYDVIGVEFDESALKTISVDEEVVEEEILPEKDKLQHISQTTQNVYSQDPTLTPCTNEELYNEVYEEEDNEES